MEKINETRNDWDLEEEKLVFQLQQSIGSYHFRQEISGQ